MLKFFVPRILAVEMSRVCAGMALSHGASVGLCARNILSRATPEQKKRFAGPILRFEKIGCWALTEPQAGSAAIRDMRATAVRDGDHWVLNGSKTFITNAPYADTFVVCAKVRENGSERPEAFLCERGDPGLETGKPFHKMGFRSSPTGEVFPHRQVLKRSHYSGICKGSLEYGMTSWHHWLGVTTGVGAPDRVDEILPASRA
jgi:alkylation response protein AidB-like acyl-CoA dehydrogenase